MSWADASCSLEDLIFQGVKRALHASGTSIDDVDSVVLAAHDLVDGRSLSSMVTAPAAGAYLRDEIRLAEDGLVALSLAGARVAAGESELSIVAAWGRASEGDYLRQSRAAMDPFLVQPFGLTDADISAFRLSRWLGAHGPRDEARIRAAQMRVARARKNPRAIDASAPLMPVNAPLRADEAPRGADIVVAALVGSRESACHIAGIGHGTDATLVGDRDWLGRPALRTAVDQALGDAGLSIKELDFFEIDGMTLADEALALEVLGLAEPGDGFGLYARSDRINPSGGSAAGWCYPAMGLVRFAECFLRLDAGAKHGLAAGSSPIGEQTQTAVVLERS
jgi:acetyl-CoA C-acetyltransferase